MVLEFFNVSLTTQGSGIGRKLSFNKEALSYLAASESSPCDKEGPLFLLEKTEGLFKRTEGMFYIQYSDYMYCCQNSVCLNTNSKFFPFFFLMAM